MSADTTVVDAVRLVLERTGPIEPDELRARLAAIDPGLAVVDVSRLLPAAGAEVVLGPGGWPLIALLDPEVPRPGSAPAAAVEVGAEADDDAPRPFPQVRPWRAVVALAVVVFVLVLLAAALNPGVRARPTTPYVPPSEVPAN